MIFDCWSLIPYATGRGEILEDVEVDLTQYKLILINPKIHVNTRQAFSLVIPDDKRQSLKDIILAPLTTWREQLTNDFERSVFDSYPEIKTIKDKLYESGAIYSSMTGSGSSVFGIFEKNSQPQFDFPAHYLTRHL